MLRQPPVPPSPSSLPGSITKKPVQQLERLMEQPDNHFVMVLGRGTSPPKSSLSLADVRELGQEVAGGHHLRGSVRRIGNQVVVGIKCPDVQSTKHLERGMALAIFRWDGFFGSAVTFTLMAPGRGPITSHTLLGDMLSGENLVVVPFYRGQPISVITSERYIDSARATLDRIAKRNNEERRRPGPLVTLDPSLSYWETFHLSPVWDRLLSRQDRLQISWARLYMQQIRYLFGALKVGDVPVPTVDPLTTDIETRRAAYPLIDEALWDRAGVRILSVLHGRGSPLDLVREIDYTDFVDVLRVSDVEATPFEAQRVYLGQMAETIAMREAESLEGLRAVFADNSLQGMILKHVPIPLDQLNDEQAGTYWDNVPSGFSVGAAKLVSGGLVPANLQVIKDQLRAIRLGCTQAEAREAIRSLTDEANVLNRWTIPWGARVQVRIGPFEEIDFYPCDNEISILLRTADGGYRWGAFNLRKDAWNLVHVLRNSIGTIFADDERPLFDEIELAIQLLLVTIVRDFVVLEDRTVGFAVMRAGRAASAHPLDANAPRIIYIPRVRYIHDPDVVHMNRELEVHERVPHQVRPHLRRSDNYSPFQAILAARYGFTLKPGHTFVRPHYRGGLTTEREVIYRSRSAMRSLYGAAPDMASNGTSLWFKFEQDVADVMSSMGFTVDHVAASRSGDEGVDVFAENRKTSEAWAIQCKCYAPDRKIGPAIVRELIGALTAYPAGTRGMIVTTSSFSTGAIDLAHQQNIVLNGLATNPATGEVELRGF